MQTSYASFFAALDTDEEPRAVLRHALEQLVVLEEATLPIEAQAYVAGHAPRWREAKTVGDGIELYVTRLSRNEQNAELAELARLARVMAGAESERPVQLATTAGPSPDEY